MLADQIWCLVLNVDMAELCDSLSPGSSPHTILLLIYSRCCMRDAGSQTASIPTFPGRKTFALPAL